MNDISNYLNSFAIAQSAVLAIFEARIERKTEDYRYVRLFVTHYFYSLNYFLYYNGEVEQKDEKKVLEFLHLRRTNLP
jgi:hypothetical protein